MSHSVKKEKVKSKLKAPSNWAKLIGSLKEDLSSDETAPRRRRAYTEMDDLLNNDIMEGGDEALEIARKASESFK